MQSLKIGHLQGFCIIELAISQSGLDCDFFSFTRAHGHLLARLSFACVKWLAIGSGRRRVGREFLRDMESVAIGSGRRRVEGRGFLSRSMDHIWSEESPGCVGNRKTRAIGLLPSRARLGIYAKFALSFAKLPKMQTLNVELLDTSFYDFWQIIRMQSPNTKLLEML